MSALLVADIPVWGKFTIMDVVTKKILHEFDGEGHGDLPPEIAVKKVIAIYSSNDKIIVEV